MFNRNDLTLSLFYASSTNDDGDKVASLTVQVNNSDMVAMQSNKLQCITDKTGKKAYSVGEQMITNGSDPLLVALEDYWRRNTETVVTGFLNDVGDFIAGNISQSSTFLGFNGLKVFENEPLTPCSSSAISFSKIFPEVVKRHKSGVMVQLSTTPFYALHMNLHVLTARGTPGMTATSERWLNLAKLLASILKLLSHSRVNSITRWRMLNTRPGTFLQYGNV